MGRRSSENAGGSSALDDLDRRLIGLLRADARLPSAALARQLGVSRGTVQNRIDRLTAGGVLLGFTVRLAGAAEAAAADILLAELEAAG